MAYDWSLQRRAESLEQEPRDPDARHPPNGKAFDIEGVDLYRFHDGLLCDHRIVYDLLQFSAQMGLLG